MAHIFLSYSHKDEELMSKAAHYLEKQKVSVWTDKGIEIGSNRWKKQIERAIESAGCFVVLLTPNAKQSEWVQREIEYAHLHDIRMFSVLVSGQEKESVPFLLAGLQHISVQPDHDVEWLQMSIIVSWYMSHHLSTEELAPIVKEKDWIMSYIAESEAKTERVRHYIKRLQSFETEIEIRGVEMAKQELNTIHQRAKEALAMLIDIDDMETDCYRARKISQELECVMHFEP
ncbi:MAG: TIR domain-containing protein [Anaerolineae bacterium]|nr:TIR domain-containing protein [Anaerolineae bacterium]